MKKLIAIAAATLTIGLTAPALADDHMAASPEVVERNDRGQVTKVRIDGKVIDICMNNQQDSCINPRAAGLKWGNRPLGYWPGKPASER